MEMDIQMLLLEPHSDGGVANTGRAYIFFGGSSMDNIADVILTGEATNNDLEFQFHPQVM